MRKVIPGEVNAVLHAVPYRPAVSIILPFEPKMTARHLLETRLKSAVEKVEKELKNNYPDDIQMLMTQKLNTILKQVNFGTLKKSIAIYLSPVFEKVLYLEIPVKEKIIVDESFEIRDLVHCKTHEHRYLVLVLSSIESRMFLGKDETLIRIVSNNFKNMTHAKDMPERVANFSDPAEQKEIDTEKFLHYVDNSLDIILNAYHLPVFVIGPEKILGHFKKFTRHTLAITGFIKGHFIDATLPKLQAVIEPFVTDWKNVKQKNLFNQMEQAASHNKLTTGIKAVWSKAKLNNGKLLLVENDFMYAAEHGDSDEVIYKAIEPFNKFSYIRDAVDDVIEKVLTSGGDVEFVDNGSLKAHGHIALIQHY